MAIIAVLVFAILLDPHWSKTVFGDLGARLHFRVVLLMLEIRTPDRNDNGIPDWCEWVNDRHYDWGSLTAASTGTRFQEGFYVYQGERTCIQARMFVRGLGGVWPRGHRAFVTADKPVLFLPGAPGPATTGPLEIGVSPAGTLDFDVLVPDDVLYVNVDLIHAKSALSLRGNGPSLTIANSMVHCLGKRLPPIECRSLPVSPDQPFLPHDLEWDRVDSATHYLVEMALQTKPDIWYPIDLTTNTSTQSLFYPEQQRALGSPVFRVIPSIEKPRNQK